MRNPVGSPPEITRRRRKLEDDMPSWAPAQIYLTSPGAAVSFGAFVTLLHPFQPSSTAPRPPTEDRENREIRRVSPGHHQTTLVTIIKMVTAYLFYVEAVIIVLFVLLGIIICCTRIGGITFRKG